MFIVLEGIDGSGKTTLMNSLSKTLNTIGFKTETISSVNEETPTGKAIRNLLSFKDDEVSVHLPHLFLLDHVTTSNKCFDSDFKNKFLDNIVIKDRYLPSTISYAKGGMEKEFIDYVLGYSNYLAKPDLYIYLDTPVDECLTRLKKSRERLEVYEKQDTLERVARNYNIIFKDNKFLDGTPVFRYKYYTETIDLIKQCDDLMELIKDIMMDKKL